MAKIILIIQKEQPSDYQEYVEKIRKAEPGIISTMLCGDNDEIEIKTKGADGVKTKAYY